MSCYTRCEINTYVPKTYQSSHWHNWHVWANLFIVVSALMGKSVIFNLRLSWHVSVAPRNNTFSWSLRNRLGNVFIFLSLFIFFIHHVTTLENQRHSHWKILFFQKGRQLLPNDLGKSLHLFKKNPPTIANSQLQPPLGEAKWLWSAFIELQLFSFVKQERGDSIQILNLHTKRPQDSFTAEGISAVTKQGHS